MDPGCLVGENNKYVDFILSRFLDSELVYHIEETGLVSRNYLTGNITVILPSRILVIVPSGAEPGQYIKFIFSPNITICRVLNFLMTDSSSSWNTTRCR